MNEQQPSLPVYEVEELSLEQAILELASEEEKYATQYQAATTLFRQLCACGQIWSAAVIRLVPE